MKKTYTIIIVVMVIITGWSLVSSKSHYNVAKSIALENNRLKQELQNEKAPYDLMEVFKNDRLSAKNEIEILKQELQIQENRVLKSEMQIRCQRPVLEKVSDMNCALEENYTQFAK